MKKKNKTITLNNIVNLKKTIEENIKKLTNPDYLSKFNNKANLTIDFSNLKDKNINKDIDKDKNKIPEITRKLKPKDLIGNFINKIIYIY